MESCEDRRSLQEGPGGGRGGLAPSPGLCECGERLLAGEGGPSATGPGRTDRPGRRDSAACALDRKEGKGQAGEAWTRTVTGALME